MKIWRIPVANGVDLLALRDEAPPEPGPFEVRVKVRATSLNYRDLMVVRGTYARGGLRPGLVPLSDGAGEVEAVGPGVTRWAVGDRVGAIFMQRWIAGGITPEAGTSALGGAIDGMLAEMVVLHEDGLVAIPGHLTFEEAATLPCAAVTAWHALEGLAAGETVLVLGTGGVSIFALQFARMMGARVIATSSADDKLKRVQVLGADTLINYRAIPNGRTRCCALTDGRGVDRVVEVGGAGTLARSAEAVRVGGRISLIGVLTGTREMNPMAIMRRSVTLKGIYVGSRAMFEAMNRAIALNRLRPVIDRVFDFAAAPDAYRHLIAAGHVGKVVIRH